MQENSLLFNTNKIFVCGGLEKLANSAVSSVFEVDCNTRKLTPLENMIHVRYDHSILHLDSDIYAFGGRAANGIPQKSCERYSYTSGKWYLISFMHLNRVNSTVCHSKKKKLIFIFGPPFI